MLIHKKIMRRGSIAVMMAAAAGWATSAYGSVIVTYTFDGGTNNAAFTAGNVTVSAFDSSDGTTTYVSGKPASGDAINDVGWKSAGNFYQFSVTPDAGYRLDLTGLTFDDEYGTRGPTDWAASYRLGSSGGFTSSTSGSTHSSFTGNSVTGISGIQSSSSFFLQLAGTGANNDSNRTWAIDNVTLNGDVTSLAKMSASVAAPSSPVLVGTAVNFDLSVSNTATGGTQQEKLNYSASSSGDVSGSETVANLTAAGSPHTTSFSVDTSAAGAKSGSVLVNGSNAYSINGTAGQSSFSQNIAVDVLDHSNASFLSVADTDTLNVDFGTVLQNSSQSQAFSLANLVATTGFTAGLDLSSFGATGDSQFSTDLANFDALAAGDANNYQVTFDTSSLGTFSGVYTLHLGDDHTLTGAAAGQTLTLNVTGTVEAVPEPGAGLLLLGAGALGLLKRRRAKA